MSERVTIPDITLERYRLNELAADEARRLDALLNIDATLRDRMATLDQSDIAIRQEQPPALLAQGITSRLTGRSTRSVSPIMLAVRWGAAAAAVALLAVVVVRPGAVTSPTTASTATPGDEDRVKGLEASLAIYRRTDAGSELLADGDRARDGDLLRIAYKVADPGYGVILSVDGRGLVTVHLPADGGHAARLADGNQVLLDRAYELDDAPKWERFYLITATSPFDVEPVLSALKSATGNGAAPATLSLTDDLGYVTFVLQKDTRP